MWERFSFYGMRAFLVLFLVRRRGRLRLDEGAREPALRAGTGPGLPDAARSAATSPIASSARTARSSSAASSSPRATSAWPLPDHADVLPRAGAHHHRHRLLQVEHLDHGRPALRRGRRAAATPASPSSTWGSTSARLLGQIVCGYFAREPAFGLALRLRRRGRRHGAGPGDLPALQAPVSSAASATCRRRARAAAATAPRAPLTPRGAQRAIAAIVDHRFLHHLLLDGLRAGRLVDELLRRGADRPHVPRLRRSRRRGSSRSIRSSIICSAPLFAALWTRLARRGREPSTPVKIALALILMAVGFVVHGRRRPRQRRRRAWSARMWLVAAYRAPHLRRALPVARSGCRWSPSWRPRKLRLAAHGRLVRFSYVISELLGRAARPAPVEKVEKGQLFHLLGGQADFFLIFVVVAAVASAALLLALTPAAEASDAREGVSRDAC